MMSDAEREAALELLRDPKLLDRIVADFDKCGLVGEHTNLLVGYLCAVSRKLDDPLAVLVQSPTAAGKTSLMDAVLSFVAHCLFGERPALGPECKMPVPQEVGHTACEQRGNRGAARIEVKNRHEQRENSQVRESGSDAGGTSAQQLEQAGQASGALHDGVRCNVETNCRAVRLSPQTVVFLRGR